MKTLALLAAGLGMFALPAFAQEAAPPPPHAPSTDAAPADLALPPPPPAPGMDAGSEDMAPPPPPKGPGPHGRGPRGDHDGPRGDRDGPPPPPSKAAHFRLKMGENSIDVKCADDEPMKACSDILMQILDRASPKQP